MQRLDGGRSAALARLGVACMVKGQRPQLAELGQDDLISGQGQQHADALAGVVNIEGEAPVVALQTAGDAVRGVRTAARGAQDQPYLASFGSAAAPREEIDVRLYSVIYDAIEEMLEADVAGEQLLTAVNMLCHPRGPNQPRPVVA